MNGLLGNAAYYMQRSGQQPGGLLPAGPASFQGTGGGRMLSAPAGVQQMPSKYGNLGKGMEALGAGIESFATAYKAKQEAEKTKAQWTKLFTPAQTEGGPTVQNAMTAPIFGVVPGMTPEKAQFLQMVGPQVGMPWVKEQVLKVKDPEKWDTIASAMGIQRGSPEYQEFMKRVSVSEYPGAPDERTTTEKEYAAALKQGFKGTLLDFMNQVAREKRPQTNIFNVPAGYQMKRDPATGEPSPSLGMEPVPGGPVATELAAEAAKKEKLKELQVSAAQNVVQNIDSALGMIEADPTFTTGLVGSTLAMVPGTAAHDLMAKIETIEGNLAFDKLQAMRDASPTGGALGSIAVAELNLLKASVANLRQSQNAEELKKNLNDLRRKFNKIIHGSEESPTDLMPSEDGGLPSGSKYLGTTRSGQRVYQTPDGRRVVEE